MEALIITLREGIEAVLVVAIMLATLRRLERTELARYVWGGVVSAVVASIAVAIGVSLAGIDPENELVEGIFYFTAAGMVATLMIWMWRHAKHLKRRIEQRVTTLTRGGARQGFGLALFAFFMVFREGVETVLFMGTLVIHAASEVTSLIGGVLGLSLALLFGVLFLRGAIAFNLKRFFQLTSVMLLLLTLQLSAGGIHEFTEVGLLPSHPLEMRIIGALTRDQGAVMVLVVLLTIPVLLMFLEALRSWRARRGVVADATTAVGRKQIAEQRREMRVRFAATAGAMIVIAVLILASFNLSEASYEPPVTPVAASEGAVAFPLEQFEVGRLYKFSLRDTNPIIRFMVLRFADRVVTTFDTCEICPPLGYAQLGKAELRCKNCGAPLPVTAMGEGGGCMPIPLMSQVVEGQLIVRVNDLLAKQEKFR